MKNPTGIVFNIQRYSIHDGPGIRTTVFLKGCPLSCFWCQNPESQAPVPEILFDSEKCTRCGACIEACPAGATQVFEENILIDRRRCTHCGRCIEVCPAEARRMAGKRMSVSEVMDEVSRDARFYENSGGGITLSGGEPLAQPDFAFALLERSREADLHTALETCGYASWKTIARLLPLVDFVLFDIKHPEGGAHRRAVGKDNRRILENARRIAALKPMLVRVPLIPGFNDSPAMVTAIARLVSRELNGAALEMLPYNPMGEAKYRLLDRPCTPMHIQSDAALEKLNKVASCKTDRP